MAHKQTPIGSGYTYKATAFDIVEGRNLDGKLAIVTGGGGGIGLEAVRALAAAGATVVAAARDVNKAAHALQGVSGAEAVRLDLEDGRSIDAFAERFLSSGRPLHMLINNAGVMAVPESRDARGFEQQFATNHLGHYQLTVQLWPALLAAGGARVVTVSSRGHRFAGMDFDDPNFERRAYNKWAAYGQSKTANALFAMEVDRRGEEQGIRGFSVHPGRIISTSLSRFMSADEIDAVPLTDKDGQPFTDPADYVKSIAEGAATSVWCAVSPQLSQLGGLYCEDCDVAPLVAEDFAGLGVRPHAADPALAERLWTLSEQMTGRTI